MPEADCFVQPVHISYGNFKWKGLVFLTFFLSTAFVVAGHSFQVSADISVNGLTQHFQMFRLAPPTCPALCNEPLTVLVNPDSLCVGDGE